MVRADKEFDCVKMKWAIQQEIHREFEGLSPQEAIEAKRKRIEEDPVLGPFLKKVDEVRRMGRDPSIVF